VPVMKNAGTNKLLLLQQPLGGLFNSTPINPAYHDEPRIVVRKAELGDVGAVWPEVGKRGHVTIRASGSGLDDESALIPALAEGLERYSACVYRAEQFVWATGNELGEEALDLDAVPKCSASELAHPKCPLVIPDKSKPIRWVRGISLSNGRLVWIPVVMVYSQAGYAVPEERFWISISTGCAAHTSYERALLAGIYELVERDILAIAWLQQLALPRIEIDIIPSSLASCWERYKKALAGLEYIFFDATSDLGVPTAYGLQVAPHNRRVTTLVACATGITMAEAIAKTMRDMVAIRPTFRKQRPVPESWDDFTDLLHGATFMARAESAPAFAFLTESPHITRLSKIQNREAMNASLQSIVKRLGKKKMEIYVVDLTTDEGLRADMRVLRAIIPGLQPFSFRYRARFLGHPRLYLAPKAMGYASRSEEQLNPWPQPFA